MNHEKTRSSPALAWAPQVRVRKRIAQVHCTPGRRSPPGPVGRRARGRKAPCTPLGAWWRLRTRKVPILLLLLLLCSLFRLRFVLFASTKHHFGASTFTDITSFLTFLIFQLCSFSTGESHHSLIQLPFSAPETVEG